MTISYIYSEVNIFVRLQNDLIQHTKEKFYLVKDWDNLYDFPKKGSVILKNKTWNFKLHGVGILFVEEQSLLEVNIHVLVQYPDFFDVGRILTYLESKQIEFEYAELVNIFKKLENEGLIKQLLIQNHYKLYELTELVSV